uniref:Protein lingerer n=2 Tax=Caenorhabditis tropicalis TaxID=1561998 RepID=A0A1I7T542_9PELO
MEILFANTTKRNETSGFYTAAIADRILFVARPTGRIMGIKSDKKANSDQARLARLTLEGNSGSEEDMQLMIKTIIETTGCTQSQAEIALLDSDNNLYGAIDHILDAGDKLDSWTEQKGPKKEKKKSDEGSFNSRNYVARGRGGGTGFVDRGGRGRSNGAPRESRENRETREPREPREHKDGGGSAPRSSRGGFERPYVGRGGRGGSRGGYSRAVAPSSTIEPDAFVAELDDNSTKVDATVTEVQTPVEESVTATVPTSSAPAPISFAAVAAAAHRKEAMRKQQAQNPPPAAPPRRSLSPQPPLPATATPVKEEPAQPVFSEPETSHQPERDDGFFQSESSALAEEQTPNVSTHHDDNVQSSPEQTNQAWTTQLKTDLGIGLHDGPGLVLSPIPSAPAVQAIPDPGVEFVGAAPTNVHDYSFGFEAPPSPQVPSADASAASISANNEQLFNSSRIIPKQVEPERTTIPNGDYNLKASSPPLPYGQSNRGLSYDTSSASYPPTDRLASNKSQFNNPGQLQSQQSAQQQPQQQQQQPQPAQQQQPTPPAQAPQASHPQHPQMLFTPQMPYGYMNSYMNMYSPMQGVRDDQYAALMQYGMGVDLTNLSTILPQPNALSQSANAQQVQSGQQREAHGLMDFNKFGSQNSRDQQSQQPSNVGPPPGFQTTNYMQQPNLSSLFMQQPYPAAPHTFGFMNMMPNVGANTGARQMYGQDDDRKNYDKMAGSKPATQQNQHSQYQHNGGNLGKYGNSMNKPPYNWGN